MATTNSVAVTLFPVTQFLDNNGKPLAGGAVYTYQNGTTTPQATYTDYTGSVQAANPVILDSAGRGQIWYDSSQTYTLAVYESGTAPPGSPLVVYNGITFQSSNSGVVLTTTNQNVAGTKAFSGPTGFGAGSTSEYASSGLPVVIGSTTSASTGAQFVATGTSVLQFGSSETGTSSTLGTLSYNSTNNTWGFAANNTGVMSITSGGVNVNGSLTINGVPVLTNIGTIAIGNGGTGQTTAAAAFNALASGYTVAKGTVFVANGSDWVTLGPGTDGYQLTATSSAATGLSWTPGSSSSFSHQPNGYEALSSGLVIQWGTFQTGPYGVVQTITFPTGFPTRCASVTTSMPTNVSYGYTSEVVSVSTTQFGFNPQGNSGYTIYWMAIGY
jgi:hypothetical protein